MQSRKVAENVAAAGVKLKPLKDGLSRMAAIPAETPFNIERHSSAVEIYKRTVADLRPVLNSNQGIREEAINTSMA